MCRVWSAACIQILSRAWRRPSGQGAPTRVARQGSWRWTLREGG
jgi:hypothetical protein